MPELASKLYNVVILPVTDASGPEKQFQLSGGRRDGARRMVSPAWTEAQLHAAFHANGTPYEQVQQLLRGNRMAFGGRDSRRLFFSEEALFAMGLFDAADLDGTLAVPENLANA